MKHITFEVQISDLFNEVKEDVYRYFFAVSSVTSFFLIIVQTFFLLEHPEYYLSIKLIMCFVHNYFFKQGRSLQF